MVESSIACARGFLCSTHLESTLASLPPNTRVQRTRSSPSAHREPLMRRRLGSEKKLSRFRRGSWVGLGALATVHLAERGSERRAGEQIREAVGAALRVRVNGEEIADPRTLLATLRLADHVPLITAIQKHPSGLTCLTE
jgi:hypothetical protein